MAKHTPKFDPELVDALLAGADPKTVLSSKGLFGDLKKALAERMLQAELEHHLDQPEEEASLDSPRLHPLKILGELSMVPV